MNFFLIGLMGSGKSFLAHQLSAVLNMPAFDLDKEIEKAEAKTIAEIFARINLQSFCRFLQRYD